MLMFGHFRVSRSFLQILFHISLDSFFKFTSNRGNGLLFSGLHQHPSMAKLRLVGVGLAGEMGGAIISAFLRSNSRVKALECVKLALGLTGALALQPAVRSNKTLCK
jgi:hypothetical protein